MFPSRKGAPVVSIDAKLLRLMVEDTPAARALVVKNQSDLLTYRREMDGGMVAAGSKSGIAMADDGGVLLFDKSGVRRAPLGAVVDVLAHNDQYQRRTIGVKFDMQALGMSRKREQGIHLVEFQTEDGFRIAATTLGQWWKLFHPEQ